MAAAAWIVTIFVAPYYDPLKFLGQQSTTSAGLAALFLGAIISIRIYDFVNRKAERRQLRHEYALSRVKDIYVPLWDETVALIELVERYDSADLRYGGEERDQLSKRGFAAVMKGPLRLFVDSRLQELLSTFHADVQIYNKVQNATRTDLYDQAGVEALDLTKRSEDDSATNAIATVLRQNDRLIWGATDFGEEAVRFARDRFREAYARIPELDPAGADAAFDRLVQRLRSRKTADTLRRVSRDCAASGQRAIQRLEEIVRDPTSVVLEFGD